MSIPQIALVIAAPSLIIALSALFILGGSRMTEQERIAEDDAQMEAIKDHEKKKRLKAERRAAKKNAAKKSKKDDADASN